MAHAALKELLPAQVIPLEQPVSAGNRDPLSKATTRLSVQDRTGDHKLDRNDLAHAMEVLAGAALSQHVHEAEVRKLATRVDEAIEQFEAKLRQAENGRKEAERRAQVTELRAAEAERWLRRLYDEIMKHFSPAKS
jgi:predicted S18 family serine protease